MRRSTPLLILLAAALAVAASVPVAARHSAGAVYTATNDADGNAVLVFERAGDGTLAMPYSVPTGGLGTGGGLGNQGGVVLSDDQSWLLVVNAGSDELSVFEVESHGLRLAHVAETGGSRPVSVDVDRGLVYVLHAGDDGGATNDIRGFTLDRDGVLSPLPDSVRPLSDDATGPAQVAFSPGGDVLVVTEKATNRVDTYLVGRDGLADGPQVHASPGQTPFGFAFGKRDQLFVSEAAGGDPDASTVSSYEVLDDGTLAVIEPAMPTTETAACWLLVDNSGRYLYTTNTPDGTVTGIAVSPDGGLELLDPDGVTVEVGEGTGPIDPAITPNGRYVYTLNRAGGTIGVFEVGPKGSLEPLPFAGGVPEGANGLAAR